VPRIRGVAARSREVFIADILGTGELGWEWQTHMIAAGAGVRCLGVQVAQIHALWRGIAGQRQVPSLKLHAYGLSVSVAAVIARALEPGLYTTVDTEGLPDTLGRLVEWPVSYEEAPSLFCFGLLEHFDVPDLVVLCGPVVVRDGGRGPLQPRAHGR
jgi:hypothetical protein